MFSISITSNATEALQKQLQKLSAIDVSDLAAMQASTLLAAMRDRIHVQGLNASGTPIGIYSPAYLKRRAKHGRGANPQVVLSYTRQLEKSYVIVPMGDTCGIGVSTAENRHKVKWLEDMYGKVFSPTKEENELIHQIAQDFIKKKLK